MASLETAIDTPGGRDADEAIPIAKAIGVDEPLARSMVAALLQRDDEVESVLECGDAVAAREMIARQRPDIVFLDIEMPGMSGLEIAGDLAEDSPVIVFITAFSQYAPQAFEVDASDYVLKPFSDRRFSEARSGRSDACDSGASASWRISSRRCRRSCGSTRTSRRSPSRVAT